MIAPKICRRDCKCMYCRRGLWRRYFQLIAIIWSDVRMEKKEGGGITCIVRDIDHVRDKYRSVLQEGRRRVGLLQEQSCRPSTLLKPCEKNNGMNYTESCGQ